MVALSLSPQLPLLTVVRLVGRQLQQDGEEGVDPEVGDVVVITHLRQFTYYYHVIHVMSGHVIGFQLPQGL